MLSVLGRRRSPFCLAEVTHANDEGELIPGEGGDVVTVGTEQGSLWYSDRVLNVPRTKEVFCKHEFKVNLNVAISSLFLHICFNHIYSIKGNH